MPAESEDPPKKRAASGKAGLGDPECAVLDLLGTPLLVLERDGRIRFGNAAMRRLVGADEIDPPSGALRDAPWIAPGADGLSALDSLLRQAFAGKSASGIVRFRIQGGDAMIVLAVHPLSDGDGAPDCAIVEMTAPALQATPSLSNTVAGLEGVVLDATNLGFVVSDEDRRIVEANGAMCDISGYGRDELIGKSLFDFLSPEEARRVDAFTDARKWSAARSYELEIRTKSGATKTLFVEANTLPFERGYRSFALMTDVTEQRRAESRLRESEERFRLLSEVTTEAVLIHDRGRILDCNRAAADLTGVAEADLVGRNIAEFILPEEKERIFDRVAREDEGVYEGNGRAADGRIFPARVQAKAMRIGDQVCRVASVRDLSSERAAEAAARESLSRYEALLRTTRTGYVVMDSKGRILEANEEYARMIGDQGVDALIGHTSQEWTATDRKEDGRATFRACIEDGKSFRLRFNYVRENGDRLPVLVFGGRTTVPDGSKRVLAFYQDISDEVAMEQRLHQAVKMEAVGQLTGGISHDFNNLLSIVLGNLELLRDRIDGDNGEAIAMLDAAAAAVDRGARLTDRLLAFSRKQPLRPTAIDLRAGIEGLVEMLSRVLGETIEIRTGYAADLRACRADPAQLEAAILNIALNARDAMPDGGWLAIEAANARLDESDAGGRDDPRPGEYVVLSVSDCGTGMTADILDRVFEPFYTTKEVGQGSGLGMSMVYGFAKQSEGHVTLESQLGVGTTVRLYLPASRERRPADAGHGKARSYVAARGERILLVEDDADLRALLETALRRWGYAVLVGEDGHAALACLDGGAEIDMLLTDVVLPGGMSGRDLAAKVTARFPDARLIYMSGYTEETMIHHGRLDPDVTLVQKPFRLDDLSKTIRAAFDS